MSIYYFDFDIDVRLKILDICIDIKEQMDICKGWTYELGAER